jgi:hypothetical protein
MTGDGRGEHPSEPAEGSRAQGEEAEERVRREQQNDDADED